MDEPTHYEVLAIPKSLIEDSSKDQIPRIIKKAYHRALLRHHPDKTNAPQKAAAVTATTTTTTTTKTTTSSSSPSSQHPPTIDQITRAYTTLSHQAERAAYDRRLALTRNRAGGPSHTGGGGTAFQTGIETVDLDDLDYTEEGGTGATATRWHRGCRCGNDQGFTLGEDDLEEAGDLGELVVGCQDCSLWLKVCFAVVVDDDDDEVEEDGAGGQPSGVGADDSSGMGGGGRGPRM